MTETTIPNVMDLEKIEEQKNEFLKAVLAQRLGGANTFLVSRTRMGHVDAYIGKATFKWIANNIMLFTQLPMLKSKLNEKGQIVIDEQSVQDLQQRAPNWSRQQILTMYLFRQPRRKFPPMLVVVQEAWVNDPDSDMWDENGCATRTSMPISMELTPDGSYAILDLSEAGVTIYVIDGSHRYIGIKGLKELMDTGKLMAKKPDGSDAKTWQDKDKLMAEFGVTQADVDGILDESMGIEFIPAVIEGETMVEARRRVRSVFVHVNKTAQPPTKGEIAILDEDNGFAIVAKAVAFSNKLFKKDDPGDRINWKTNALPKNSKWLTTSVTLIEMVKDFLGEKKVYAKWKPETSKEIPFRPVENELEDGETEMNDFLNRVAALPVFTKVATGTAIDDLREFSPDGAGHLLMRPIGQQILAEAVGYLFNHPDGPKMTLDVIFKRLTTYDKAGGFENISDPKSAWYGLTYNPYKKAMAVDKKKPSALLLRHLLHNQLTDEERKELLTALKEVRQIPETETYWNWDGTKVSDLGLPVQIS
ncbi:DNA sulfur modification protein DndB [Mycobacterium sp. E796]|uniref:DNA sulfur modification protein DndB n=1 Tax=Mycobacterium sp. E796 TaxID=1834151 RepID=UPI0007FC0D72|nr:DNA sulfur modification protein DndB [Mycobacterium sp. E796]OBI60630.1 hypothetical protein A5706_17440 [Mycobacterium sp. E796]